MTFRLFLFLFCALISQAAFPLVTTFTDRSGWENALTDVIFTSENFSGARLDIPGDSRQTLGLVDVRLLGGVSDPGPTGLTGNGFFQGEVDAGTDPLALSFAFQPVQGFALTGLQNDSLGSPANLALDEIAVIVQGQDFILSGLAGSNTASLPFLGFVSDTPFDGFTFNHAALLNPMTRRSEEFYLDALHLAQPVTVPEPPIYALLLLGLLALMPGAHRRRYG